MEKALDLFSEKLATMAEKYGPEVVAVTMKAAWLAAAQVVLSGVVGAALFCIAVAFLKKQWKKELFDHKIAMPTGAGVLFFFVAVASIPAAIVAVVNLFDIYAWASLDDPRIWLAHKLLGL